MIKGLETGTFEARPGWLVIYAFISWFLPLHALPHHPATQTHSPALDPTWGLGAVGEKARSLITRGMPAGASTLGLHKAPWKPHRIQVTSRAVQIRTLN